MHQGSPPTTNCAQFRKPRTVNSRVRLKEAETHRNHVNSAIAVTESRGEKDRKRREEKREGIRVRNAVTVRSKRV